MTSIVYRTLLQCGEHVAYFNKAFIVTHVFVDYGENGTSL
jgi:hypothetical protein